MMNKIAIIIAAALILPVFAVSVNPLTTTYGQTGGNATELQAAKSIAPQGSLTQAAEPGTYILTGICPPDATGLPDCEWFVGVPVQP